MVESPKSWVVHEEWEGDGTAGAAFQLPNGMTVFVTEWTDRGKPDRMTEAAFVTAKLIRDLLQADARANQPLDEPPVCGG